MKKALSLGGALLTVVAAPASAQLIVPLSETRQVLSSADTDDLVDSDSDSDSQTAVLYEYFSAAVSSTAEIANGFANAGASQDSLLGSTYITASGSAFAVGESYDFMVLSESFGSSIATVEFLLTAKAAYHWHGDISASDNGISDISFFGPSGFDHSMTAWGPSDMFTIDESGVLEPGIYTVELRATGSAHADGNELDHAFADFQISLDLTALSGRYCISAPNSAGTGAVLLADGSQSIAANEFQLGITGARPNGSGLFFYGPNQIQVPFGDGFRCVGGQTYRMQPPVTANGLGVIIRPLDFTAPPANGATGGAILPLSTWNFQLWYRDPGGPGGTGFNLSDALWVTFCE